MITISDAIPAAEETYETGALQEIPTAEIEARVDSVARPLIEELGRLIDEAKKTTEYSEKQRRNRPIEPRIIAERKEAALTFYAAHADRLSGPLTQEQCSFLLRIASDNRNFLALERLLSTHHAVLSDSQILQFSKLLPRDQIQAFLNSLDIPKFISLYRSLARELPVAVKCLLLVTASTIPDAAYSSAVHAASFDLAMELEDFDYATNLILNKSRTSPDLSKDISVLATRLRNKRLFDRANSFLASLPASLFDQVFSDLFKIFSDTPQVKQVLYRRALDSSENLFNGASYRNAFQFFLTNDLDLAKRLILEKGLLSSSLGRDTLDFVRYQKASNPGEACHFVRHNLPDANFALCWNELLSEFQTDPETFNFLVDQALQTGRLTDASFTDAHQYLFEETFKAWTPAYILEATRLFGLLEGRLSFYNQFNDGAIRPRKSSWAMVDFDLGGVRNTASNIMQVDCHGFSRHTALIQLYSVLVAAPRGTRILWIHGAGIHSAGGVAVLKSAVPTLWTTHKLPLQILGPQMLGATQNFGATVVEKI